ncbi:unnamed protein product, partial [Choristocarpus tenellus]
MLLSGLLYALLASFMLFPSRRPAAAAHQRFLLIIYAPLPPLLIGLHVVAVKVLGGYDLSSHWGMSQTYKPTGDLANAIFLLTPLCLSALLARCAQVFPSPPSVLSLWAKVQAQIESEVKSRQGGKNGTNGDWQGTRASTNSGHVPHARLNGHGSCDACLHEDGGVGAMYTETDIGRITLSGGVSLGPGFRVLVCNCPIRDRSTPALWCEFCLCCCKVCGGEKEAARVWSSGDEGWGPGRSDKSETGMPGPGAGLGAVAVLVLYLCLWLAGLRLIATPCHCLSLLSCVAILLCAIH